MEGTATTTPQIKNLIGPASENKRAARAARTYEQVRAILCKITTWNYLIYSFDDNLSIKPQIFNVAHTNPIVAYFANNIECEQDWTIENSHDWAGVYFKWRFPIRCRRHC